MMAFRGGHENCPLEIVRNIKVYSVRWFLFGFLLILGFHLNCDLFDTAVAIDWEGEGLVEGERWEVRGWLRVGGEGLVEGER